MVAALNMCSILENFSYSKSISDEELNYLDEVLDAHLASSELKRFPSIAPAIVCASAKLTSGSLWIDCCASILDQERPLKGKNTRLVKLHSMDQSSIVHEYYAI